MKACAFCGETMSACGNTECPGRVHVRELLAQIGGRVTVPDDPETPDERQHPELARLCAGMRERGVPCDGWTPVNDALGAIDRARVACEFCGWFGERRQLASRCCPKCGTRMGAP